ncbi:MAG: hypothetical protein ACLS3M_04130 [Collinsella sp.]
MARFPLVPTAPEPERAVLVGVEWRDNAWPLDRSLDELERLAHTAGAQCVARLSQRLVKPYPKSFIGSGKVEELCGLVHRMDADVVIFDDDLRPRSSRILRKPWANRLKIIDRTALISISLACTLRPVRAPAGAASQFSICCLVCVACGAILPRSRRAAASVRALARVKASSRLTVA